MSASEQPAKPLALAPLLEENVEDLYENAPCGYLSSLVDGTVVRVNGTFLAWTGHARGDLLDRLRLQDLLAPGDRIFYETHYAPLLQMQGFVRELAVDFVRADGSRLPALLNSVLRREEHGDAAVIRTTVFDATDRRRYERELLRARREAEERARFADALGHAADGVVAVDADGRITLANAAAEELLGLDAGAAGRPMSEVVPAWAELAAEVPVGSRARPPAPVTLPFHRHGREQWLALVGVASAEAVVYTIRDVTADRRLETLRDDLIGIVSHELRTPLTGVAGAAQTLAARPDLPAAQRDGLVAMIVEQAARLERILDEILLARCLDVGGVEPRAERFDLAALAAETAAEVAAATGAAAGRVRVLPAGPVVVAGDSGNARQALANIVDNALKYSPAEAPVEVRVEATDGRGRASVADEGPGVPAAERERVFDRFHRLDPRLSQGVGGVGLGLYIARELVERMGGRVGVEPRDVGSTFFVELPLAPADGGESGRRESNPRD